MVTSDPLADGIVCLPGERIVRNGETLVYAGLFRDGRAMAARRPSGEVVRVRPGECRMGED